MEPFLVAECFLFEVFFIILSIFIEPQNFYKLIKLKKKGSVKIISMYEFFLSNLMLGFLMFYFVVFNLLPLNYKGML